jgi:cytosine deaminase
MFGVLTYPFHPCLSVVRFSELVMPTTDPFLQAAIEEARQGRAEGGIPIGSVVVHQGKIIGRGEMDALENTGRQSAAVYRECILYTTLSPCSMCSGAILLYGIPRVIIGENRTFMGEEDLLRSRGVALEVVQNDECIRLMEEFIRQNPRLWNEDIGV